MPGIAKGPSPIFPAGAILWRTPRGFGRNSMINKAILALALLSLALNLMTSSARLGQAQSAEAAHDRVGRYQIAAWGGDHWKGYYVLDTWTGKVIANTFQRVSDQIFEK